MFTKAEMVASDSSLNSITTIDVSPYLSFALRLP